MITTEKAIEAITKKLETLQRVGNSSNFSSWKTTAINTLLNIYNENDIRIKNLQQVRAVSLYSNRDLTNEAKVEAKEILDSIISDIKDFGLPISTKENYNKALNLNINQTNNQSQSTNINISLSIITDAIKGELRNSEIDILKEIIESSEEPTEKKKKFIEKIKSFGSDVSSNILANIITNPQVYGNIGDLF